MNGIPPFNVLSTPVSMSIQGTKNLTNMDYSADFFARFCYLIAYCHSVIKFHIQLLTLKFMGK